MSRLRADCAVTLMLLVLACDEQPPRVYEPPWLSGRRPPLTEEEIPPGTFPVVKGADYVGAIVPEDWIVTQLWTGSTEGKFMGWAVDGFWTPSTNDVDAAERAIRRFLRTEESWLQQRIADGGPQVDRFHRSVTALREISSQLAEYRRQYIGIVVSGERRVYCNFALRGRGVDEVWRDRLISVLDGGTAFWRVQYNVSAGICVGMGINGVA